MSARKEENFYRRDPMKALSGMAGLSMDEKAVYNTMLDLMYVAWKPLHDNSKEDRQFIANWVGCAPQKLNPIISRLIEKGRIVRVEIEGKYYLTDQAFEAERTKVKGEKKPRSQGEVEQKSGEVGENSEEVEQNPPLLDIESEQNQDVVTLEERREEKRREETTLLSASAISFEDLAARCGPGLASPSMDQGLCLTQGEISLWQAQGFDLELDVLPVLIARTADRRPRPINTWKYFTPAIAQAFADRTRQVVVPLAQPPPKTGFGMTDETMKAAIRDGLKGLANG